MLNSSIVSYHIDVVCYWQEYASITNNCHTGRCLRRCLSWNVLHWRTCCPLSSLISLLSSQTTIWGQSPTVVGPMWARERCRISPPRFLDEYCLRRLNQASFCFAMFCVVCFLADRTNGRAIATLCVCRRRRLSVCLWRYVLWLNGAS